MYSNKILNFQEFSTILNAHTKKKSGNLSNAHCTYIYIYIYIYIRVNWVSVNVYRDVTILKVDDIVVVTTSKRNQPLTILTGTRTRTYIYIYIYIYIFGSGSKRFKLHSGRRIMVTCFKRDIEEQDVCKMGPKKC